MAFLSKLPLFHHNRSRFLYNLDVELLKHWANLQRALDGKAFSYVPTDLQRANIAVEQDRLDSARLGLSTLARIWEVEPKAGKEIPERARGILIRQAHVDSARVLAEHRLAPGVFQDFSIAEVAGLEELFHYLDAKVCLMEDVGEPCAEYMSLREQIGYVVQQTATDAP